MRRPRGARRSACTLSSTSGCPCQANSAELLDGTTHTTPRGEGVVAGDRGCRQGCQKAAGGCGAGARVLCRHQRGAPTLRLRGRLRQVWKSRQWWKLPRPAISGDCAVPASPSPEGRHRPRRVNLVRRHPGRACRRGHGRLLCHGHRRRLALVRLPGLGHHRGRRRCAWKPATLARPAGTRSWRSWWRPRPSKA